MCTADATPISPSLAVWYVSRAPSLGYDAARTLASVHRLGSNERPSYRQACELVPRSRALVDPVSSDASVANMEELVQHSAFIASS